MHDPPLEPRDEVVFLLTAAAEIEHALMVQYLYAAYSVRVPVGGSNENQLRAVQSLLTQIAREEMGHLATVQNLLHLVGGPLNLNRTWVFTSGF
jgi:rubrerythrin